MVFIKINVLFLNFDYIRSLLLQIYFMPSRSNKKILALSFSLLILNLIFIEAASSQQVRKSIKATRITISPVIDGILDDEVWGFAEPGTNFFQYEPYNDRSATYESFVWVLYDNNYMYIGAKMLDPEPNKILTEMGLRDEDDHLNADRFWIDINPFEDGIYGFSFRVSASGVQTDISMSQSSGRDGDRSWDAVWQSKTKITEEGWEVEMKIPYSALRFPSRDIQQWGINFWREIRRARETSSWNFVDRSIGDLVSSMGLLTGVEGVKPPLRLALFPYTSAYLEKNGSEQGWAGTLNGGMDLKYGITESFTLDVTLIPDFGQVQSDAKVLNLSPYEVKYDEKRQFFTEGIELFRKADLFYSRRIGARPSGYTSAYNSAEENEEVVQNPLETRLINATKLSGRTKSGLGIGIFNAITASSHALIRDSITGQEREFLTQPFTNYNFVVLDQSLKNNSFVSLVNTNVAGKIDGYTGNVTGTEFRFRDKTGIYRISGAAAVSQQYYKDNDDNFGYKYNFSIGKYGGTWQYNYSRNVISDTYHQNDLGFMQRNNLLSNSISLSHKIFEPFWILLNLSNGISMQYRQLYLGSKFTSMSLEYYLRALSKSRFFVEFEFDYEPLGRRDYFEPRVEGRFYEIGPELDVSLGFSTDYRKRLYVDGDINFEKNQSVYDQKEFRFELSPTFRVNNRFNLGYEIDFSRSINNIGYVRHTGSDVFFGMRDNTTTENTFQTTYIFTNNFSIEFDMRHYWSRVDYKNRFFLLQNDGTLEDVSPLNISDINYNAFTIDMKFTWHFAPGSQMTVVWKNIIETEQDELIKGYFNNIENLLDQPQINSFSVKILYYLDYKTLARKR